MQNQQYCFPKIFPCSPAVWNSVDNNITEIVSGPVEEGLSTDCTMADLKSFRSAVVIIPPEELWDKIQEIRSVHDKAYKTWMPHINLLFPFLEDGGKNFKNATATISEALRGIKPFRVSFRKESFGFFQHGSTCTVWLKPLTPLQERATPGGHVVRSVSRDFNSEDSPTIRSIGRASTSETSGRIRTTEYPRDVRGEVIKVVQPRTTVPVMPALKNQTVSGMDALQNAVWRVEENQCLQAKPAAITPGLDCLRYAEWGHDDANIVQQRTEVDTSTFTPSDYDAYFNRYYNNITEDANTDDVFSKDEHDGDFIAVKCKNKSRRPRSTSNSSSVCVSTPTMVAINTDPHPEVMKIQRVLETKYPLYNELSTKSSSGFAPHLTLGQVTGNPSKFLDQIKSTWKDIEFDVSCVHLISRKKVGPHEIRQTAHLSSSNWQTNLDWL